jgi:hypothetical protein
MSVGIFIDGTWFYYSTAFRNRGGEGGRYAVSWHDLPDRILSIFGLSDAENVFVFYSTSVENLQIGSQQNRGKKEKFLMMLQDFGYCVEAYETSVCSDQGKLVHSEKCVDMAVGTELVLRSYTGELDSAIVVSGDRDFYPAIERAIEADVSVGLITSKEADPKYFPDLQLGSVCIEDIKDTIRRDTRMCKCPDHGGDPWVFLDSQEFWGDLEWCDRCLNECKRACNG